MIYNATKSSEVEKGIANEEEGKSAKEQVTSNTDGDGNGAVAQPSNLSLKTSPQGTLDKITQEK